MAGCFDFITASDIGVPVDQTNPLRTNRYNIFTHTNFTRFFKNAIP